MGIEHLWEFGLGRIVPGLEIDVRALRKHSFRSEKEHFKWLSGGPAALLLGALPRRISDSAEHGTHGSLSTYCRLLLLLAPRRA